MCVTFDLNRCWMWVPLAYNFIIVFLKWFDILLYLFPQVVGQFDPYRSLGSREGRWGDGPLGFRRPRRPWWRSVPSARRRTRCGIPRRHRFRIPGLNEMRYCAFLHFDGWTDGLTNKGFSSRKTATKKRGFAGREMRNVILRILRNSSDSSVLFRFINLTKLLTFGHALEGTYWSTNWFSDKLLTDWKID